MKSTRRIVIDTNVLVAGLRSRRGSSFELLQQLGRAQWDVLVTVPLVMEYDEVLHRSGLVGLDAADVDAVIDYVCSVAVHQSVFFLWRPRLTDARDDMVLEAAFNGGCQAIVTWNVKDFSDAPAKLGIKVLTPAQWLEFVKE